LNPAVGYAPPQRVACVPRADRRGLPAWWRLRPSWCAWASPGLRTARTS